MSRRAAGFTLLELIIALALIGMALASGFAALRLAARSMENTDRLVDELEEMRIVRTVVQRHLSQAMPLRESVTERQINFQGNGQQLEFIAPAPTQGERMMGLYRYRLRFAANGQMQGLVLEYQPYEPGAARAWSSSAESTLLAGHLREGEFAYFGANADGDEEWQPSWRRVEHLPRLVRIVMLGAEQGHGPMELVVALPVEWGK